MTEDPEIELRFTYHAPHGTIDRYVAIRDEAKHFAYTIVNNTPTSREQSLAITSLEEVVMWANAAIARRDEPQ